MASSGYFKNGYWWVVLVVLSYITAIGGYYIISYYWIV